MVNLGHRLALPSTAMTLCPALGQPAPFYFTQRLTLNGEKAETQGEDAPCKARGTAELWWMHREKLCHSDPKPAVSVGWVAVFIRDTYKLPLQFMLIDSSLELNSFKGGMIRTKKGQRDWELALRFAWSLDTKIKISAVSIHLKNLKGRFTSEIGYFFL